MDIKAPIGEVFDVVTSPDNWIKFVSGLVEISDSSDDLPALGGTFLWKYKMMGFTFGGKGMVSENSKDQSFAMHLESKFPIKEAYQFRDKGDGITELEVTIDYEMPGPMQSMFGDTAVLVKMNDIEAKGVLEKIKALCEPTG
jgi:hypothetical protein